MSVQRLARAEKLASLFPPLLIEAERVADAVWLGTHGRRRAGRGENFWQYRPYDPSEPAARIDWRQSARGDRLFVREREWEAQQTACLWSDGSASMNYASTNSVPTKADQARVFNLALASLLLRGGEKIMWADGSEFTPLRGKSGLEHAAMNLSTDLPSVPPDAPSFFHGHVVLASDFLMPPELLEGRIKTYAARNLQGVLLHILDPLEESFALDGRVELQGPEGEKPLLVSNATSMRGAYAERLAAHRNYLKNLAEKAGWFYLRTVTSDPLQPVLLRLYEYLKG